MMHLSCPDLSRRGKESVIRDAVTYTEHAAARPSPPWTSSTPSSARAAPLQWLSASSGRLLTHHPRLASGLGTPLPAPLRVLRSPRPRSTRHQDKRSSRRRR